MATLCTSPRLHCNIPTRLVWSACDVGTEGGGREIVGTGREREREERRGIYIFGRDGVGWGIMAMEARKMRVGETTTKHSKKS